MRFGTRTCVGCCTGHPGVGAWRLLLLLTALLAPAAADYFISHPECGFFGAADQFVHFERTAQLNGSQASIGVCNWGIQDYSNNLPADAWAGHCLQCKLVPFGDRAACPAGWKLDTKDTWQVAPVSACSWTGCLDLSCPADITIEGQTAACGSSGTARQCCPIQAHRLCCRALDCTRTSSVTGCVVDDKALTPGQVASTTVYAVAAATRCSSYTLSVQRTCQANWTLTTGPYHLSCSTVSPGKDINGCPAIPGYDLKPSSLYSATNEAELEDATLWQALPASSVEAAMFDPVLMASRCDQTQDCAAFDARESLSLRSYVPVEGRWSQLASNRSSQCSGTYVRQFTRASCPRVPGYVHVPGMTWTDPAAGNIPSDQVCSNCGVSQEVANRCSQSSSCAAFSNMHGLLYVGSYAEGTERVASLSHFTSTPCKGLFLKAGLSIPTAAETLDRLLCGEASYCQPALHYAATQEGQLVDVRITLASSLTVPSWLLSPNEATLAALPRVYNVRSLHIVCPPGTRLAGGFPRQLLQLLPGLEQLSMPGCGIQGSLADDLGTLAPSSLWKLDLSGNGLQGELPRTWGTGAWKLSLLNLSSNSFKGYIPDTWVSFPWSPTTDTNLNVLDLSHNQLEGPLPKGFVKQACISGSVRLELDALAATRGAALDKGSTPILALYSNPGLKAWAGDYLVAQRKGVYSKQDSQDNMCGSFWYIIVLSALWGGFFLTLLGILVWWLVRQHRLKNQATNSYAASLEKSNSWFEQYWPELWVRQLVFLTRALFLLPDIALDVLVAKWLWENGAIREAAACMAFLAIPQVVVALSVFGSILLPVFPSLCALLVGGLPVLVVTPVIAPVMAVWNIFNSEVPLVSWRYLELLEFAVMLFQSPSQSITQSIIYAQQGRMGGGMYLDHPLFAASIALSLINMSISVFKLTRYKHGPWVRIRHAFTQLDQSRDLGLYQPMRSECDWYSLTRPTRGESYQIMHNPLLSGAKSCPDNGFGSPVEDAQSRETTGGGSDSPRSRGQDTIRPLDGGGSREYEVQPAERQLSGSHGNGLPRKECSGGMDSFSRQVASSSAQHSESGTSVYSTAWSIRIPPPPMQQSMMQNSSMRLAMNSAMDALASSIPVAVPVSPPPGSPLASCNRRPLSAGRTSKVVASPSAGALQWLGPSPLGRSAANSAAGHGAVSPSAASPHAVTPRTSGIGRGASEVAQGLFRHLGTENGTGTSSSEHTPGYHSTVSQSSHMSSPVMSTSGTAGPSARGTHAGPAGQLQVQLIPKGSGDAEPSSAGVASGIGTLPERTGSPAGSRSMASSSSGQLQRTPSHAPRPPLPRPSSARPRPPTTGSPRISPRPSSASPSTGAAAHAGEVSHDSQAGGPAVQGGGSMDGGTDGVSSSASSFSTTSSRFLPMPSARMRHRIDVELTPGQQPPQSPREGTASPRKPDVL